MKRLALIPFTFVLATPMVGAADAPVWPADVKAKDDPRILTFYDEQCAFYADQNDDPSGRDAFIAKCRESIASVFPVGTAKSGGGE
ncbi:MAG: hypothetical protein HC834_00855 [Rhodospirillales bacterium]|nr:hypothetical protein [Rhodospirillales bacterium]